MASHHLTNCFTNRLTALALQLGLATATAMVLWITWTGYLLATGQVQPRLPASAAKPAPMSAPDCPCHRHPKPELQVQRQTEREAT